MQSVPCEKYQIKNNGIAFSEVYHICHISDAIRIIEDGRIVSSLIWDESCLNNTRTLVSWVSPNTWPRGSIYDHVSFVFDWADLSNNKKFYWVEAITKYNPDAYRILITDKDQNSSEIKNLIVPFDPFIEGGPIQSKNGIWFRNDSYTAEFMIDSDLSVSNLMRIEFEDHNNRICKENGCCRDKDITKHYAGAILLASIIGRRISNINDYLLEEKNGHFKFHYNCLFALLRLFQELVPNENLRVKSLNSDEAISAMSAALVLYGNRQYDEARTIGKLIGSKEKFFEIFKKRLQDHFSNKNIDIGIQELKGQISVNLGRDWENG